MLDKWFALLQPGGALLLDVYSLRAFDERVESATYAPNLLDGFWSPHPYFGFLNTFEYEADKLLLDKHTIVEETGIRVIYNWLQHFDPHTLELELQAGGFVLEALLGDVAGASFDPAASGFAVIGRKPSAA